MVWYMVSIPREYIDTALEVVKITGVILASHYPGLDIHKDMERILERDHEGCEQIVAEVTGVNNAYR